jgi:hypothetical protein
VSRCCLQLLARLVLGLTILEVQGFVRRPWCDVGAVCLQHEKICMPLLLVLDAHHPKQPVAHVSLSCAG